MSVRPAPADRFAAIRIFAVLALVYVISHFYRVSNAVIAPDLMRDVGLSAEEMGVLSGAFFLAFAAVQLPVGMMLDRFGTRWTVPAMLVFAVAGALVFAASTALDGLVAGRVLMGLGCAGTYVGALVVLSRWFPARQFAIVAGLMMATGNAGNLLATEPLAYAADAVGWRTTFVALGAVAGVAALLEFVLVRDAPPGHAFNARAPESPAAVVRGVGEVWRNPQMPPMFVLQVFSYSSTLAILGLWGAPYLHDVHGMDLTARGGVLLWMTVGLILGGVCVPPLERVLDSRKRLVCAGAAGSIAVLAALALIESPPVWLVALLWAVLAFLNAYHLVILAHARAFYPDRLVGRAMTVLAFGVTGGVAAVQIAAGVVVGAFTDASGHAEEVGYRAMYAFIALLLALGLAAYVRVDDIRPSRERPIP